MPNRKRFLITCADEKTWKFDQPVLFLGEWCKRYDRKNIWNNLDAIIAKPYGINNKQKIIDYDFINSVKEKIFEEITPILNETHCVDRTNRYWRILLGHWLHRYIATLFNRYYTIKQAFDNYEIVGSIFYKEDNFNLCSNDTSSFIRLSHDEQWNNILFGIIVNYFDTHLAIFKYYENKLVINTNDYLKKDNKKSLLQFFYPPVKYSKHFITSTYLPIKEEFKLHLGLRQMPYLVPSINTIFAEKNSKLRMQLKNKYKIDVFTGFERFVRELIWDIFPISYLEGYHENMNLINTLNWPKNPKTIFTSNRFDADDLFKLYTAEKTINGKTKYIIGQHGNNYGTSIFSYSEQECLDVCDRFVTWGWNNGNEKVYPAFNFKIVNKKQKHDTNGKLLLIQKCLPERIETWDVVSEYKKYLEEQFMFYENLPKYIQKQTIIRLQKRVFNPKEYSEEERWRNKFPNANYDDGSIKINKRIADSRIIVHSYDSTGILETLAYNIPTLAFWQNELEHLNDDARAYYKKLHDVGIIHFTYNSLIKKIIEIWEKPLDWWQLSEIQNVVTEFSEKYSKNSKDFVKNLVRVF